VTLPPTFLPITRDNGPRGDSSLEKISKLKPAFDPQYGTVTAANASFLTDGASAVLLMSEPKAKALGLRPKAYLKSYAFAGTDPLEELLTGPAYAIPTALDRAGLSLADIDVLEIHEAFAASVLAVIQLLGSKTFAKKTSVAPRRSARSISINSTYWAVRWRWAIPSARPAAA
jgi:acetyl-CoA acyltransferase